jgi:tetratricopeptide (TPR) repeat protein
MRALIFLFIASLIFFTAIATYTRNFDWASEERIWADAMTKAPGHSRPKESFGFTFRMKNPEKALDYYSKAMTGYMHNKGEAISGLLSNMGSIYFNMRHYEKARYYFNKAIKENDMHWNARSGLIRSYMVEKKWGEALEAVKDIPSPFLQMKRRLEAACYLYLGEYSKAVELFGDIYRKKSTDHENILNMAEALSLSGYHDRAQFFYALYLTKYSFQPDICFRISKNFYLKGEFEKASSYLKKFFTMVGAEKTKNYIKKMSLNDSLPFIETESFKDFVSNEFESYKKSITVFSQE